MRNWNKTILKKGNQEDTPNMKLGGDQLQKLQGKCDAPDLAPDVNVERGCHAS